MSIDYSNRKTRILTAVAGVLLAATIGAGFYYVYILNSGIDMPSFISMTRKDTEDWAAENKIGAERMHYTYRFDEEIEKDTVLEQTPEEGTRLGRSDEVSFVLSDGPDPDKEFDIPDFTGRRRDDIEKWFADKGFRDVTFEFSTETDVEENLFVSISPNDPMLKRSQPVVITISAKSDKEDEVIEVTVPDFRSYTRANIQAWANTNKINVTFAEETSNTAARGMVIRQSAAAGTKLTQGSRLVITLSSGKGITIASQTGKTRAEAADWCRTNGIRALFQEYYSDQPAGTVLSQNPSSGMIGEDSSITFQVSAGLVNVDNYTGRSRDAFTSYINAKNSENSSSARLSVKFTEKESDAEAGTILSQSASGPVNPGTVITAEVAVGRTVAVDVRRGMAEEDFKGYLSKSGMTPGIRSDSYHDSVTAGCIITNDSGRFPAGSRINYTVSRGAYAPDASLYSAGASYTSLQTAVSSANSLGAGWSVSASQTESDAYEAGQIISCSVSGKSISCSVSSGKVIAVPDVSGQTPDAAKAALEAAGFKVSVQNIGYNNSYAANTVFAQDPAAGTRKPAGTTVTIRYSDGPEPVPMATLPNIPLSIYSDFSYSDNVANMTSLFNNAGFYNLDIIPVPTGGDSGYSNQNGIQKIDPAPNGAEIDSRTVIHIYIFQPDQ